MRRTSLAKTFKNNGLVAGLRGINAIGRHLTLRSSRRIGRAIGRLAFHVVRHERKRALKNVSESYPELTAEQHREIVRGMFHHLGTSLGEIFWMQNLNAENFAKYTAIEGLEHFQRAKESGRGVVLFTGHCGNWEWLAASVSYLGMDLNVVAREIFDERLNDFIVQSRARHGVTTIGRGSAGAARELLRVLRSGKTLGVLTDQSIEAESVMVDFFGRPAPTPVGPSRLAIRGDAIVMMAFAERRGEQLVMRFEKLIEDTASIDEVELTQRITKSIENQIRRVPEQWVWMHKRWSIRHPTRARWQRTPVQ